MVLWPSYPEQPHNTQCHTTPQLWLSLATRYALRATQTQKPYTSSTLAATKLQTTDIRHASAVDVSCIMHVACRSPHIAHPHPLGTWHLAAAPFRLSFSPNTAPALTPECVKWRECEVHKLGHRRTLSQGTYETTFKVFKNCSHHVQCPTSP